MGIPAPAFVSASGLPPLGDLANAVLSGTFVGVGPSAPFAMRGPMNAALYGQINTALTVTAGSLAASVTSGAGLVAGDSINSLLVPPGTTWATFSGAAGTLAIPAITIPGRLYANPGLATIRDLPSTVGLLGATVSGPGVSPGSTVVAILVPAIPVAGRGTNGSDGVVQISTPALSVDPIIEKSPFVFQRNGNAILASGADGGALFTGGAVDYTGSVQLERSFDGGSTWIVCNIGGSGTLAIYAAGTNASLSFGEPEREVLYRFNCTAYTGPVGIAYRLSETGGAAESLAIGALI